MTVDGDTQGRRIRALFENTEDDVSIIAPFIKVDALRLLLEVFPSETHLRCVTRWLPKEVAAGVSDPEILDVLEKRGNFSLSLVDTLHAKLYIAGDRCLVGSANVTHAGLGERGDSNNIEILVDTTIDDPGVVQTLGEISKTERPATRDIAQITRRLADSLSASVSSTAAIEILWSPVSRRPQDAYLLYTQPPSGFTTAADRTLLNDLAKANLQPGLEEDKFRSAIRSLLQAIPIAENFLKITEDTTLTFADTHSYFKEIAGDQFSANELWLAFVEWMAYFFNDQVMRQEITEIALRRAQILG
ncbi:MAG: phospholipase D family protein [Gemmatimonadetes bacterium]|nr:phospholipase D family protein [Gemmatimonadota bacterium]